MTEPKTESSQLADCKNIPIIDLSSLDSPNFDERRKLAQSIYDACTQVGFFYIKVHGAYRTLELHPILIVPFQNHGIPEDKINAIHCSAKRLFDLPEEQKMKFYIGNSPVRQ